MWDHMLTCWFSFESGMPAVADALPDWASRFGWHAKFRSVLVKLAT